MHLAFKIQRRYNLDKNTPRVHRGIKGVVKHIICPNDIKEKNQQMIYS
jgi:hypothetical protein